jgi:lipoprotein-anchoring transpeptidase ErfK/SrfK
VNAGLRAGGAGAATLPATMRLRRLLPVSFLLLAIAPGPAGAAEQVIAPGVKAGGTDVGGQTVESAATTLQLAHEPRLAKGIQVRIGNRSFRLDAVQDAQVRLDALRTAKRAYYAGRDKGPGSEVALHVDYSYGAVKRWAEGLQRQTAKAPRNATVRIGLRRMSVRSARTGRTIDEKALTRRVALTVKDPARKRILRARLQKVRPAVGTRQLRRQYGTVLTVDRSSRKLRLFKRLRLSKTYDIAIGAAGHDTPTGQFRIQSKQVNPTWHVPNSAWAGSMAGKTVPGGAPNNPLKARWLGVSGSVGIHGTAEEWSIGSRASKGCIRMRVRDVVDLYPRVPVGAPILIR